MSAILGLHLTLARAIIMLAAICAAWALVNYLRGAREITSNLYSALVATEVAVIAQALLGVTMSIAGLAPRDWKHFLYGFLAVLVLPAIYSWTQGNRRASLYMGGIALFLVGLGIRAMQTGS